MKYFASSEDAIVWGQEQAWLSVSEKKMIMEQLKKQSLLRNSQAVTLARAAANLGNAERKETLLNLEMEMACQGQLVREALGGMISEMITLGDVEGLTLEELELGNMMRAQIDKGLVKLPAKWGGKK